MKNQSAFVRFNRKNATLLATIVASLGLGNAYGQVLEEVIVTAQKRAQNLQDVPVAVSAFNGEMLVESGVKDMFELSKNSPSLQVGQTQNGSTATFGIRGIFTSSQNFGLESSVGLYVDGNYRARQSSMVGNLVDIASVEVLRGPQGTLFGRNTPAGAVSVNSVKPDFENTGYMQGDAGNYDLLSVQGARSLTLVEDVLAVRATGFYMERDGYVDDIALGDDTINDRDRWGIRLQALYDATENLSIHIIGDHSEIDEICCGTGTYKNNLLADSLPPGSPPKTGSDVRIQELGGTVIRGEDFYDYKVANTYLPETQNTDEGVSAQVDWDAEIFTLTSITAYRQFDSYDNVDSDFSDIEALKRSNEAEQSSFSQELRIANSYEKLNYVAGLYYFEQELDSFTETIVGKDTAYFVGATGNPENDTPFPANTGSYNQADQEHQSYAAFGQFDYNLTEQLVLTAGLRWTKEDKKLQNTFTQDASEMLDFVSPGWGFWLFPPLAPRDDVDEEIDDDETTGTVKLSWFMDDATMFYASYGTGYKAGGVNTDRIDEILPVVFEPETSEAYEVGVKADFPDQALRVNLALYKVDVEDLQTISFQGTAFALQNAGIAETYGGEVEVFWAPTASLNLTASYAYSHAEYNDYERGNCWIATPWHTGQPDPGANGDGSCNRNGGLLSGNPENAFVFSATQTFAITENINGILYGDFIYTDDTMTDLNQDPLKTQGSYNLVNLRASLEFVQYGVDITAWGRNVFDEEYLSTIADSVVQDGKLNAYYRDPATWGVTIRKSF